MAACLITISGTSGELRLNYKIGATDYSITTGLGTLYIEDTATSVTYTTLLGDAIASSGCLTITALPYVCFKFFWKDIRSSGYMANAVILGVNTITFADTEFPESFAALANNINALHDPRIRITKFLITEGAGGIYSSDNNSSSYSYIIQVLGSDIPQLRVKNADNTGYIYIHGVSSTCSPVGYTDASEICLAL